MLEVKLCVLTDKDATLFQATQPSHKGRHVCRATHPSIASSSIDGHSSMAKLSAPSCSTTKEYRGVLEREVNQNEVRWWKVLDGKWMRATSLISLLGTLLPHMFGTDRVLIYDYLIC